MYSIRDCKIEPAYGQRTSKVNTVIGEAYPTAPVPRVISKIVVSGSSWNFAKIFLLFGIEHDPSIRTNLIPRDERRPPKISKVFIQHEKTMLSK